MKNHKKIINVISFVGLNSLGIFVLLFSFIVFELDEFRTTAYVMSSLGLVVSVLCFVFAYRNKN